MPQQYSAGLLAALIPLVLVLACAAPVYWLLLLDTAFVMYPGEWQLGGSHLDASDLCIAGIMLALLIRPATMRQATRRSIPYVGWWVVLGSLFTLSYVLVPLNQNYLTGADNIAYQIYRYCWRPVSYYVLAAALLQDRRKLEVTVLLILVLADLSSLEAIRQGYAGWESKGPLFTKNQLGSALITPTMLALAVAVYFPRRAVRRFGALTVLLIARAQVFAGSRGAFVASMVACAVFALWLVRRGDGFKKMVQLSAAAAALAMAAIIVQPELMTRPNIEYLMSASHPGEVDTMQWREQERWPYFTNIVLQHPWIGVGTDVDIRLDDYANTPHNGYLAAALIHGVPGTLVLLSFAFIGIWCGWRVGRHGRDAWHQALGAAIAAALVGLLVHNIVDATFHLPYTDKLYWILIGSAVMLRRYPSAFATITEVRAPAARAIAWRPQVAR